MYLYTPVIPIEINSLPLKSSRLRRTGASGGDCGEENWCVGYRMNNIPKYCIILCVDIYIYYNLLNYIYICICYT